MKRTHRPAPSNVSCSQSCDITAKLDDVRGAAEGASVQAGVGSL